VKYILTLLLTLLSFLEADPLSYQSFEYVHVLTVNPKECLITPVRAKGRETVLSLSKKNKAMAAVNGGFWKEDGTPAGILKIFHEWHGTPLKPRGAIGWSLDGSVALIDRLLTDGLMGHSEIIPTPLLDPDKNWKILPHIVGGTPVLIKNGSIIESYAEEKTTLSFLEKKHARTAIGIRPNGEWVVVVVDAVPLYNAGGMSIPELAEFMLELECIDAVNLDGGSSSTMVLNNAIINTLYKEPRAVSDAILFIPLKDL
jgi:exopolysaccharide biosynthesis protein